MQALTAAELKEKDPVAREKLREAEMMRVAKEQEIEEGMKDILDPKTQDKALRAKVGVHAKPVGYFIIGCLAVTCVGVLCPLYGWFLMETMTGINLAPFKGEKALDEVGKWIIIMTCGAFVLLIAKTIAGIFLARVAENVTLMVRKDLYQAIIRKDIGWHDMRENGAGVMTATLASDVQLLNGVSSDGVAIQVEAMVAVLTAVIAAFVFSWPMAIASLVVLPFIMICGAIVAKADNENMLGVQERESSDDKSDDQKDQQILCSDSIANYKTVASFGESQILMNKYSEICLRRAQAENKSAVFYALALGISVGV